MCDYVIALSTGLSWRKRLLSWLNAKGRAWRRSRSVYFAEWLQLKSQTAGSFLTTEWEHAGQLLKIKAVVLLKRRINLGWKRFIVI